MVLPHFPAISFSKRENVELISLSTDSDLVMSQHACHSEGYLKTFLLNTRLPVYKHNNMPTDGPYHLITITIIPQPI